MKKSENQRRFAPVPTALIYDSNLCTRDKAVYALIATLSYRHGYAYCSSAYVVKNLRINKNSFYESIDTLEKVGWITSIRGKGKVNKYAPLDEFANPLYSIRNKEVFNELTSHMNNPEEYVKEKKPDFVYFILDKQNDHIKIGVSNDVEKRLENLRKQRGAGELTLVCLLEGGYELEKELHERFHEFRLYGEYFQYSEQIKAFIDKVRKSGLDCLASDRR